MKKISYVFATALILCLSGCISGERFQSKPSFVPRSVTRFATAPKEGKILNNEFTYALSTGTLIGGAQITILRGEYVPYAEDKDGVYLLHKERGFIRSGNMGIADRGGIFIPRDETKPCEIWMVPHGNDAAIGLVGPVLAAAFPVEDPKKTVIFYADIPPAIGAAIRLQLKPNQSTNPPRAETPRG